MAEILGAVAAVQQLIVVASKLVMYCAEVAHASAEAEELSEECSALLALLHKVKKNNLLQNETDTGPIIGPVNGLKKRIDELAEKLRPQSRLLKLSRDMLWPLLKKEIKDVMGNAQRLMVLLNSWLTTDIKDTVVSIKQDTTILPSVLKTVQKTMSMTMQNESRKIRETLDVMLDYFSPVSFSEKQNEIFGTRQPGTGQWFLDSHEFQDWLMSPGATLWCQGAPGSGKTFIASIVVDYLEGFVDSLSVYEGSRPTGLAYIYCDFRRQNQHPTALLANIWTQLLRQRELSKADVDELDRELYSRRVKLTETQINGFVEKEFTHGRFKRIFIVIDALDECNETQRDALLNQVTRLHPWANVLITSRVRPSDPERFADLRHRDIVSDEADMKAYIEARIRGARKLQQFVKDRPSLLHDIVHDVSRRAQKLFLLCKLHMDSVALEPTIKAVKRVLSSLPAGDTAMKETYDGAVQRIESQHPSTRDRAIRTIQWVCFAMRPLTATELVYALAITPEEDDTELDTDNIISPDDLVEYCGGLVVIEPESRVVRFVHFTTQEYFESLKNTPLFAGTDGNVALTCITFLGFDDPFLNEQGTLPQIDTVLQATPFLDYAAVYFGKHYHRMLSQAANTSEEEAASVEEISAAMCKFFADPVKVHRAAVSVLFTILGRWQTWPGAHDPVANLKVCAMDLGAFYGVVRADHAHDSQQVESETEREGVLTVRWFKDQAKALSEGNRQTFGNPLHWAALGDSVESMQTLLQDSSLDPHMHEETNTWALQPAHVAAVFGSVGTLRALLEYGDLNVRSRVEESASWTGTILHLAIRSVNTSVATKIALIDTIVQNDVEGRLIDGYDIYFTNPLTLAVGQLDYAVFERVLRHFDQKAGRHIWNTWCLRDRFGKTALHWAVVDPSFGLKNRSMPTDSGPLLILKALLDHPLAWQLMCAEDGNGHVPFQEAVCKSQIHAVECMLGKMVEHGWPASDQLLDGLNVAIDVAHKSVVELLLDRIKPEVLLQPDQETVLHHAAGGTSHWAVPFLLERLPDASLHGIRDSQGMTPLLVAALTGNTAAIHALLTIPNIDIDACDADDDTPLHLAANENVGDACSILLAAGASISAKNKQGLTPLDVALNMRASDAVEVMIQHKLDLPLELDEATTSWLRSQSYGGHLLDQHARSTYTGRWPRKEADIIQVALCLGFEFRRSKTKTAPDPPRQSAGLVVYILDLAQYWVRTTSTRIREEMRQWHSPDNPFIVSSPIRGPATVPHPVRRVEFAIWSHDQGWATDPGAGNWTWFEAAVTQAAASDEDVRDSQTPRPIDICKNQLASEDWVEQHIVWGLDAHASVQSREEAWVRALRPGNVLLVKPKAIFPGWENHVRKVTIDVYTSCL